MNSENLEEEDKNQESYEDLLVAIEANQGRLALLIAVCDDSNFRDEIIARYETELAPEIRPYRVELAKSEPSLKSAVAEVVETEEYLRNGGKTVVTVTGAEKLFFLKLGAEHSEQEKFFGYLQWTREGMREFPFPIVLWMTNQILVNLTKKALDFWGWRKGVFRFVSKKTEAIPIKEIAPIGLFLDKDELPNNDDSFFLPLADLQQLIERIEQDKGKEDPMLPDLYRRMGDLYFQRIKNGEFLDYKQEEELALSYFSKSLQALILIKKRLLGEAHPDVADSLSNLARHYYFQGKYSEAEPLFLQALELKKRLLGEAHPDVADSLSNLAQLYYSQGRYSEAEPLIFQSLDLIKRLLGETHPDVAVSLNNLALLYDSQGRYSEAEPLFLQALELTKRLSGEVHPDVAVSLNNLALLYDSQGRYREAEPLFLQALEIADRTLTPNHPDTMRIRKNLAELRSKINSPLPKE
jgi:tetratricopeptide (TPR) repeat protein